MATTTLPGLIAGLIPLPNLGPATDTARAAIVGAANSLVPASPETEARFQKLMAAWAAIELRVNALPSDGSVPGAKDMLGAYRSWMRFRDAWLVGDKDGALLPAQEGALERVSSALDRAVAPVLPTLRMPIPDLPRRTRGPSPGVLAIGGVLLAGAITATVLALK